MSIAKWHYLFPFSKTFGPSPKAFRENACIGQQPRDPGVKILLILNEQILIQNFSK